MASPTDKRGRRNRRIEGRWLRVCRACGETDFSVVAPAHAASGDQDYWAAERQNPWRWSCPHCGSRGAFSVEHRSDAQSPA